MTMKGPYTGVSLFDISTLFLRPAHAAQLPDGAPNHSRRTVQLSLELAAAAYTMDPDIWSQAGWRDFSMLVNSSLMTGAALNASGTPLNDLTRATLQTLARFKMSALNPIGQFLGLRQSDEETATLKAIVMLKPQMGLMTVGIGFMGTGKQVGDWTANLRMEAQDGIHEGFRQLTDEFDRQLSQIVFPYAAGVLDRSSLSLRDIIDMMKEPGCRFRLWVCGHSQGGAVMQVFIDQLLREGVRPEYLCGFGFASPSVAHPGRPLPAEGYPITHIFNSDDLVPHLGAWQHLGECLVFAPEAEDRRRMYGPAAEEPCFQKMQRLLRRAETAPEGLMTGLAILRVLREQSEGTLQRAMGEAGPLTELFSAGEGSLLKLLDSVYARLEHGYIAVSGEEQVPQAELEVLARVWGALLTEYGITAWVRGLKNACLLPHRLYRDADDIVPSYRYIANEGVARLQRRPAFEPRLTALRGGQAAPRAAVRTVYPSWSAGRVFRKAVVTRPVLPEVDEPDAAEPADEPAAVTKIPSAPQPVRMAEKVASHVSRYTSAFHGLSALRARKKGK